MFQRRSRRNTLTSDWRTITVLLGSILLLYYLVPLVSLISQTPGTLTVKLLQSEIRNAAATSLASALTSTAIATLLGVPLAYWLARTTSWRQTVVTALVVLPLVLPPVVSGMVLLSVFGPNEPIGAAAAQAGIPLTRSFAGVVLAQTFVASPFVVVTAKAAFEGVDRQLEHVSRTLGKDSMTTFWAISLPLAKPGIIAGITLAFARAMGEFGATVMMAYYPRTMPIQIWFAFMSRGLEAAFPVAIILLLISVGALVVLTVLGKSPWR
ncbi:molybdate ABC transporter permease subunit [Haladaptatus halobius]|uniref:molybdate ABC transporter permease subunit n=1 Tax=Haladaptatus halobius TaxID=2884875 RepID=UPI001D0BAC8E|nr:ABC transporter permease subunit [Haladaptatus halobius]